MDKPKAINRNWLVAFVLPIDERMHTPVSQDDWLQPDGGSGG
jgi:hypothetical protein